ncbi:MAG TPA: hypothetical protein VE093_28220 [Polyangiaceae bacterium]|jgi:hypothetical protein|nr:hypothetical protein [Polyangiaceae bacterium]
MREKPTFKGEPRSPGASGEVAKSDGELAPAAARLGRDVPGGAA